MCYYIFFRASLPVLSTPIRPFFIPSGDIWCNSFYTQQPSCISSTLAVYKCFQNFVYSPVFDILHTLLPIHTFHFVLICVWLNQVLLMSSLFLFIFVTYVLPHYNFSMTSQKTVDGRHFIQTPNFCHIVTHYL